MGLFYDCGNGFATTSFAKKNMGCDAYLCCPGPSLKLVNPETIRGKGRKIFGINTSYPYIKPDVWMGMDKIDCYDRNILYEPFIKIFRGPFANDMMFNGKHVKDYPDVYWARIREPEKGKTMFDYREHKTYFAWHKSSLMVSIHMMIWMGAKNIYLAGCDLGGNQDYFHDKKLNDEQRKYNRRLYNSQAKHLESIVQEGRNRGIRFYSVTPNSPINKFMEFMPIEEAIKKSEEKTLFTEENTIKHVLEIVKPITVACLYKTGSYLNDDYVYELQKSVKKYLPSAKFVCLTNKDDLVDVETVKLKYGWDGVFSKLELFEHFKKRTLYIDLSTVVKKDLTPLTRFDKFTMIADFINDEVRSSAVMGWDGDFSFITEKFKENPEKYYKEYAPLVGSFRGKEWKSCVDQKFIQDTVGLDKIAVWNKGLVSSYKASNKHDVDQSSIVVYHGKPKPHVVNREIYRPNLLGINKEEKQKTSTLNELKIKRVVLINLDESKDRLERFKKQKLPFDVERFSAIKDSNGIIGCTKSHLEILKTNKEYPLLILEDDIRFIGGWEEILKNAMEQLPEDWDMLYLGGKLTTSIKHHSKNLISIGGSFGGFAIVYNNKNVVDYILSNEERLLNYKENKLPHDVFYSKEVHNKFNCFMTNPMIVLHNSGFSTIRKKEYNLAPQILRMFNKFTRLNNDENILHITNWGIWGGVQSVTLSISKEFNEYKHHVFAIHTKGLQQNCADNFKNNGLFFTTHNGIITYDDVKKINPKLIFLHSTRKTHLENGGDWLREFKTIRIHHGWNLGSLDVDLNWFVSDFVYNKLNYPISNHFILPPVTYVEDYLDIKRPKRKPVVGRIQSQTAIGGKPFPEKFYELIKKVDAELFIVGPEDAEVKNSFRNAKIEAGKMQDYLKEVDIFVIWQDKIETWCLVATEANLSGIPVIARKIDDGLTEQLKKSGGGVLVDTEEEFLNAINVMINDKTVRTNFAENGKKWCMENVNTKLLREKIKNFIDGN